ncbi:MAG: hypothetical protein M1816_005053 [Peltula sp. TS41687]|nr:MAG: hypothetical protein M1816_005053 [Peltula sp. TS41687]
MKILETQSAHLTNYEVLKHVESMRARYDGAGRRHGQPSAMKSGDLETVMKELMDYLRTPPSPLKPPSRYTKDTIRDLFNALRPYNLTKAELLMILNLRPQNVGVLDTIIEEMDDRFKHGEEEEILRLIGDVLGRDEVDWGEEEEERHGGTMEGVSFYE